MGAVLSRMWKAISAKRTIWGWIFALISALLYISDKWDSLNSFYGKLKTMGPVLKVLSDAAQSPLVQLLVFVAGVVWIGLAAMFSATASDKPKTNSSIKEKEPQPVIVAIDELKSLLDEGQRLIGRFQVASVKPAFGEVQDWRNRTRGCARQNTLASVIATQDLLKLDKPWDEEDVLRTSMTFIDHGCFAMGSTEMAIFQHAWGHVQRLKELIAKIEGEEADGNALSAWKDIRGFHIEALPLIPDLTNITQVSLEKHKKVIFTGDAALSVKNVLPAQGIDFVSFRLLSITPPMDAVKVWKGHTQDSILECLDFSADIPATLVAGKASTVKLFKVTRPLAAKSLKDVSIEFYGRWPDEHDAVFTPQERHEFVVEVTGNGVSREEATFQLRFSYKEDEPVLSIKTIRAAVGSA